MPAKSMMGTTSLALPPMLSARACGASRRESREARNMAVRVWQAAESSGFGFHFLSSIHHRGPSRRSAFRFPLFVVRGAVFRSNAAAAFAFCCQILELRRALSSKSNQ
jgi:hypothetical protein